MYCAIRGCVALLIGMLLTKCRWGLANWWLWTACVARGHTMPIPESRARLRNGSATAVQTRPTQRHQQFIQIYGMWCHFLPAEGDVKRWTTSITTPRHRAAAQFCSSNAWRFSLFFCYCTTIHVKYGAMQSCDGVPRGSVAIDRHSQQGETLEALCQPARSKLIPFNFQAKTRSWVRSRQLSGQGFAVPLDHWTHGPIMDGCHQTASSNLSQAHAPAARHNILDLQALQAGLLSAQRGAIQSLR